jgi:Zn-dependent protease with chaperone function
MIDKIKTYKQYIESILENTLSQKDLDNLYKSFVSTMSNFKHERMIHLLITISFAFFCLIFVFIYAVTGIGVFLIPCILTLILLIFYIFHYYSLENSVQSLYDLEEKILKKSREVSNGVSHS